MKRIALAFAWAAALVSTSCSVKTVDSPADPPGVENSCLRDSDCMTGATCREGACFASTTPVQQVVLEILPQADSPSGGLAYVSMLNNVANGGTRNIDLPALARFVMQVQLNAGDAADCGYTGSSVTVPARVEFSRTSSVGGAPIVGLPARTVTAMTATSAMSRTSWNAPMSLVPGTYDVYVQPLSTDRCVLAPRLLRSVEVGQEVAGWAVPATIDLPVASELRGTIQRRPGTLLNWKVDVVDAQDGRVISTSATLGATEGGRATNFVLQYQPVVAPKAGAPSAAASVPTSTSALLRVTPPDNVAAPTVYWDLAVADLNGNGQLDLNMSGIPTPDQLVHVEGRVQGLGDDSGTPATLRFASASLSGAMGLTTALTRTAKTDSQGYYGVDLFAGEYRVIATPTTLAKDNAGAYPRTAGAVPWAVTESRVVVTRPQNDDVAIRLSPKRLLRGEGIAGPDGDPALGATFDANPTLFAEDLGVLRGALAQSAVLPQGVSVTLGERGSFSVPLDPGTFDLTLRPKEGSNFAWWVAPGVMISPPNNAADVMSLAPRLPLPVAIEGVIVAPGESTDGTASSPRGLGNALVQVYARAPKGSAVTRIAETHTDARGRYRLSLPASFGSL